MYSEKWIHAIDNEKIQFLTISELVKEETKQGTWILLNDMKIETYKTF